MYYYSSELDLRVKDFSIKLCNYKALCPLANAAESEMLKARTTSSLLPMQRLYRELSRPCRKRKRN
jgi:hypothetical protein